MSQYSKALRAKWFQVGDEVTINRGSQKGIVLGFGKRHIGRNGYHCHKISGVYIDFRNILVADEAGSEVYVDAIGLVPPPALASVTAYCDILGKMSTLKIKITDLPDTPFWEGDHVLLGSGTGSYIIERIRYDEKPIRYETYGGRRISTDGAFQLVKRGNIWKLAHGEPLDFPDINEEAKFHQSLGMSQKVRNPIMCGDIWGVGKAIEAIVHGKGDQMKVKHQKPLAFVVIKYDNEEFGKRMRAHTLKQFVGIEAEDLT
jgi:hypothetical protein